MDVRDGTHDTPKYIEHGYPLITSKDFKNGKFDFSKTKYISSTDYQNIIKRSKVEVGDILYSMIGGNIGSMIQIRQENYFDMAIKNVALFKPYPNQSISTEYIAFFLESKIREYQSIAIGGAQPFVGLDVFRNTLVPLPPLAEQKRIVAEIERCFALIDQIEQSQSDLQTVIKQTQSKILDLAIHGKLVPQDPNDEPASELLKRINPKAEVTCDNGHYTQIPSGWAICKIASIANITNGKSQKEVECSKGKYPIYGSGGIIGRSNDFLCYAGSTIIGRKGTINVPIFTEENFWNIDTAFGIKPCEALLDRYFFYFCQTFDFSKLDKSSALPSLTKTTIGNILIAIPPYQEQIRIVTKVNELFNVLERICKSL